MTLRPYSANPVRALLQAGSDVVVVLWCWFWVELGRTVHAAVTSVGGVGYQLRDGAGGVRDGLTGAAGDTGDLPIIGDALSRPLNAAGGAAQQIADAGTSMGDQVTGLALPLSAVVALAPILSVVLLWAPARYRFARRAGETAALAAAPGGDALLALRALATRPVRQIIAVSPDALEAWKRDDTAVVARLADLELRRSGVRRPRPATPKALPQ